MNEKYVIDKLKEIEEAGATPKSHSHTVSDISDMPSEFPPESHVHSAGDITSGTLDAARIPALTSDKIPNLDASKITSGVLDAARIPDISGNIVSQLEGQFASKTETDAVEERVTTLETGEFETINTGTITADEFIGGVGNFNSILVEQPASFTNLKVTPSSAGVLTLIPNRSINAYHTTTTSETFIFDTDSSYFYIPDDFIGEYTFAVTGGGGSTLYVNGKLYINNELVHNLTPSTSQSVTGTIKKNDTFKIQAYTNYDLTSRVSITFNNVKV